MDVLAGCAKKVWSSEEDGDDRCEHCGEDRFDLTGKHRSKERVIHFPLKPRLESLLRCPDYVQAVRYENNRPKRNQEYMSGL